MFMATTCCRTSFYKSHACTCSSVEELFQVRESSWDLYSRGTQLIVSQDTDYSDRDVWFTSFPPNEFRDYSLTTSFLHPFSSFFPIVLSSKAIKFELLMADQP